MLSSLTKVEIPIFIRTPLSLDFARTKRRARRDYS
jgi:hypothetical protein